MDQRVRQSIHDDHTTTPTIRPRNTLRFDNTTDAIPGTGQIPFTFKEKSIAPPVDEDTNDHDEQSSSQSPKEDTHGSTKKSILSDEFPSLNSIKEYIAQKDGDNFITLHSTLVLEKQRRIINLPLDIGDITMDGLVDSGAFINAMFWSDYNIIKLNSDSCVIKEYPQHPFKIETRTAHSHGRHAIQYWKKHIHGYIRHPIEDVFSYNRAELHAKSPSSD